MCGHDMVIFRDQTTMFNVLILRVNVTLWSFWSFYIYLFKKYICMYTRLYVPITAPTCCEKMTKTTKSQKALSFQRFIMVITMTQEWPWLDHSLHSYTSVTSDMKSHDHNDHDLLLPFECQLSLCKHNWLSNHKLQFDGMTMRRGDWALRGLGISTQGLHKLFFIFWNHPKIC